MNFENITHIHIYEELLERHKNKVRAFKGPVLKKGVPNLKLKNHTES